MNYGFVIDNRTCIGCHACSTACKSENDVPLGVYRTWVKYVEKGTFPNTGRQFQVNRCNHCANPPCVRICPVTAMYQRHDGIVEFDPDVCIGCKACMQACPYDAVYIDPETKSAAKCHYCSHRTDRGLEPACVVVCPTQSIIAGDLDNPNSRISQAVSRNHVTVRKPEQGTVPKLFYIDGDEIALTTAAAETSFMWTDQVSDQDLSPHSKVSAPSAEADFIPLQPTAATLKRSESGTAIREPQIQGSGYRGPIYIGQGRQAGHMVQTSYAAQHKIPWHWQVPAYLVTKGIGSGIFILMALFFGLQIVDFDPQLALLGTFTTLGLLAVTTLLLVLDLEKPSTFLRIIFRPQMKSWLARGAFILLGFSAVAGLWFLLEGAAFLALIPLEIAAITRAPLLIIGLVLAIGTAIYTAFLFGQAEGRDLWQSTLLPGHLVVQALMVGSAFLLLLAQLTPAAELISPALAWIFGAAILVDLFVTLLGEFGMPHATQDAARAAHAISHGKYRHYFWSGSILLGHVLPLACLLLMFIIGPTIGLIALAAIANGIGLYLFEYAYVMAPQEIPNS